MAVEGDAVLVLGDVTEEAVIEAVTVICQQVSLSGTFTKIAGIQRISEFYTCSYFIKSEFIFFIFVFNKI
jgi:hypothetical protein